VQQITQRVPPADGAGHPRGPRRGDWVDRVERRQQLSLDSIIARRGAGDRDELAAVKGGRAHDPPTLATDANKFSSVKYLHRSNDGVWRRTPRQRVNPSEFGLFAPLPLMARSHTAIDVPGDGVA
jgi:hypothetical protein